MCLLSTPLPSFSFPLLSLFSSLRSSRRGVNTVVAFACSYEIETKRNKNGTEQKRGSDYFHSFAFYSFFTLALSLFLSLCLSFSLTSCFFLFSSCSHAYTYRLPFRFFPSLPSLHLTHALISLSSGFSSPSSSLPPPHHFPRPATPRTALHYTTLHYATLTLHRSAWLYFAYLCPGLVFLCSTVPCLALPCLALYYTALHCSALLILLGKGPACVLFLLHCIV